MRDDVGRASVCVHVRREAKAVARLFHGCGFVRDAAGDADLRPEVFFNAYRVVLR